MRKIFAFIIAFVLCSASVLAQNSSQTPIIPAECPTQSLQNSLLFIFIGFFMLALLLVNELVMKIPLFGIIAGMGFMMYAFTMFGCDTVIGYVFLLFGVGIVLYEITKMFKGDSH